jgi:hypothetical protein
VKSLTICSIVVSRSFLIFKNAMPNNLPCLILFLK